MECKICGRTIKNAGALTIHQKNCEYRISIKNVIINSYVNDFISISKLSEKYNLGKDIIREILGDNIRTTSESCKIAHKLYPENFKHTNETKQKIREKRLKFMKDNPEKTAWRTKSMSYPEKVFLDKIYELGFDKKYSIIREYSVFPYFIDFAFVNEKIAIEIDGSQHLLSDRKDNDVKKDKLLNDEGWFVLRISENEVKRNINSVFGTLISIINVRPKIQSVKLGVVKFPKKRQKKERNEFGFTEKQIDSIIKQRKQTRPPLNTLLHQTQTLGFPKTGRIYKVSENTIRKWIKAYHKGL